LVRLILIKGVFYLIFSSLLFLFLYFAAVILIYYCLPRKFRNVFLFVANLIFYGYGEPVYILLMVFSITMNYVFGLLIGKYRNKAKLFLVLSVVLNLGLLGFFKYTSFIVESLGFISIFKMISVPEIVLPIGISFYTFQTMSYVIDVYRENCPVQKDYILFGTYVALFPQLIAGPIVRYIDVAEQLGGRTENLEQFTRGVKLFLVGVAKKVLIANQAGKLWSLLKYDTESGILGSWVGILAFTLQIYFDFSGYSDMARGLGNMFGFEFMKNFDYPYISKSITEFWRRWHISLGTWFKEYVYIPLGGNRCKWHRHLFNIFVVWFLTGLWHGASWNFVIWGVYFGVLLVIEKYFLLKLFKKLPQFISHIYTMFFVIIGWAIFDFTNFAEMISFIGRLFTLQNGFVSENGLYLAVSYLPILIVGALACLPIWKKLYYKVSEKKFTWILEGAVCAVVLILCVASLVKQSYNPFLYFRF